MRRLRRDVRSDDQVAVEPEESYSGREVSFRVKKSMMGRIGGKWPLACKENILNVWF